MCVEGQKVRDRRALVRETPWIGPRVALAGKLALAVVNLENRVRANVVLDALSCSFDLDLSRCPPSGMHVVLDLGDLDLPRLAQC